MSEHHAYQRGWDDGYAEGYGAKLADVTAPFMPVSNAAEVERIADWLQEQYRTVVPTRSDAIGMARGMIRAAQGGEG